MNCAVCFCYFSAVRYKKTLNNFFKFKNKLLKDKIPHFDIELLYKDQEKVISDSYLTVHSDSYMFHKENLFNILEKHIDPNINLIFLDSDIEFSDKNWFVKTSQLLESYDIVQPMEVCYWPEGHTSNNLRKSCAFALANNIRLNWKKHFCGFGFGINRNYFKKINGLFDKALIGGGDAVFWQKVAKDKDPKLCYLDICTGKFWENNKYYYPLVGEHLKLSHPIPKISYLKGCLVSHMPHGKIINRQYVNRVNGYLLEPLTMSSIFQNSHGVFEWLNQEQSRAIFAYFKSRKEDG